MPAARSRSPQPLAYLGLVLSLDRHFTARLAIDIRLAGVKAPRTKGESMLAARLTRARLSDCNFQLQLRPMGAFADSCAIPSTTHTVPARNEGTLSMNGATPSPTLQPSAPVTATSAERLINTRRSASTRDHLFALPALARNEADSSQCVNDSTRLPSGTVLDCPVTTALRLVKFDHAPLPNASTRFLLSVVSEHRSRGRKLPLFDRPRLLRARCASDLRQANAALTRLRGFAPDFRHF
jgi:hypothetical protein